MSAPETNIEKHERRHRGPLIGIAVILVFAGIIAFVSLSGGGDEVLPIPAGAEQAAPID